MTPQIAPYNPRARVSSNAVWPLRCADGRTFAERKKDQNNERRN